ncbi:putative ABC transporter permease subunit [Coprothermobacter platensis]|uniref:putative ABC transporter permease subunit n=1 Tax=Coprothermobacter platensis TaxID=108819 RepID=UPI00037D5EE6|nr:hypothetical protein [Coprothermobacter platensis]
MNSRAFFALLKTQFKIQFNLSALVYKASRDKRALFQTVSTTLVLLVLLFVFFGFFSTMFNAIIKAGSIIGQPQLVLVVALLCVQLLELVVGVSTMMSTFYYAQDLPMLITLPFKPWQVIASKFIVALATEYIIAVPILAAGVGLYAYYVNVGVTYWIAAIFVTLTAPLLPLSIAALIVLVLMRFVNLTKSRSFFTVLGSIFGAAIGIGVQVISQRLSNTANAAEILSGHLSLVKVVGSAFPPALWGANSMFLGGVQSLLYLILFLAVSCAGFVCVLAISEKLFYKAALAGMESTASRRRLSPNQISKAAARTRSHTMALLLKEWKLFWRTPMFVANGLTTFIIIPIAFIVPMLTSSGGGTNGLLAFANTPETNFILNLILSAMFLFSTSMSSISYTAFSREGNTFWMSLILPVDKKEQVNAKLMNCLIITSVLFSLMLILFCFFFKRTFSDALMIILVSVPPLIASSCVEMSIDALMPHFNWVTPQELFKRSGLTSFIMLLAFVPLALMVLVAVFLIKSHINVTFSYIILLAFGIMLAIVTYRLLLSIARKLYASYE